MSAPRRALAASRGRRLRGMRRRSGARWRAAPHQGTGFVEPRRGRGRPAGYGAARARVRVYSSRPPRHAVRASHDGAIMHDANCIVQRAPARRAAPRRAGRRCRLRDVASAGLRSAS
eukprot:scaffold1395_cov397-Prasinococcus_capsulatus_cf.AAC.13